MYLEIPAVDGTPESRIKALQTAKPLLTSGGPFSATGAPSLDLIRVATYIETGHDYLDTHPQGKRRPVIKEVTNVTVVAPPTVDQEDIEHLIHHVENGDFADFLKDVVAEAEAAQTEANFTKGLWKDKPETAENDKSADDDAPAAPPFG